MKGFRSKALRLSAQKPIVAKFVRITLLIVGLFIALLFLPWRQTAFGTGRVTALNPTERDYAIVATYDGVIEKFFVTENQFVKKSDPLFRMRDLDANYKQRLETITSQTQARIENEKNKVRRITQNIAHQNEIFRNGKAVYDDKLLQLRTTIEALMQKKEALQNSVHIARINYERYRKLYREGIESKRELELKENRFLSLSADLNKTVADLKNTRQSVRITQKQKARFESQMRLTLNELENKRLQAQNAVASLRQQLQRDTTQLERFNSNTVRAKSDGYVVRIFQNDTNKLLKKGETILRFSPLVTKRAIRLRISDFNMPLIKKGLKVRIMFYGWPAMQISGWPNISHGTYGGIIHSIERTAYEKNVYYALIVEDPDEEPWPDVSMLRIGTQASIWVQLGVVPIWYELWRLMAAQPPQMITPQYDPINAVTTQIEAKS